MNLHENRRSVYASIRVRRLLIGAFAGLAALTGPVAMAEDADQAPTGQAEATDKSYLLVLTAASGELKEGKLVLRDASDKVGWFTDRPYRETGRFDLKQLPGVWTAGSDSFKADPPNAVLVAEGHETDPTIVELTDLVIDRDTVTFSVEILEGSDATPRGGVTLIVDDVHPCAPFICPW